MEIKTNTITQGEVLSLFAPIDTFLEICDGRKYINDGYMSNADIENLMPFVDKAQKAADIISRFALDNVNSKDKEKREIINLIRFNYSNLQHLLYIDHLKGYDSTIDMLNNHIKSVVNQIQNTLITLNYFKEKSDRQKSDEENNSSTDEKKSETITALEQRIKELEAENETLRKENEELKEIKSIMDTPLDGIEANSKVGLTVILKLMKNDGADFEKSKNKTNAAKALKMMTGRSESACKQIFSDPLSHTFHKRKINEMNGYLSALGMKTRL